MAWIRVTSTWRWNVNPATCIVYKPGEYNVPRACAELAVAAGKAEHDRRRRPRAEKVKPHAEG